MVSALAEAGAALRRPDYLDAARRCADFLLTELRPHGALLRTWRDGAAKIDGLLEDHAFLADALITLFEASGVGAYVATACELVDEALRRFDDGGVVYDTASDAQPLLIRPRTIDDNPIPAGQSVLASALLRLASAHRRGATPRAVPRRSWDRWPVWRRARRWPSARSRA